MISFSRCIAAYKDRTPNARGLIRQDENEQ